VVGLKSLLNATGMHSVTAVIFDVRCLMEI